MHTKRGEGGTDIATLIILIALFIFIYMLLIPVEEREDLLGSSSIDDYDYGYYDRWDDGYGGEKVLLSASPGQVYEFDKDKITKEIFPVSLFSKLDEKYVNLASTLNLGFNSRTLMFNKPEGDVKDLKLFFLIPDVGKLKIKFNGNVIFNENVNSGDVPIDLPVHYLKNTNSLTFEKGFFSNVKLSDLKLRFDILSENIKARRTFVLTAGEKEGMKRAELSFFLNCLTLSERGNLRIVLNDRVIRDDVVFCDTIDNSIDIHKDYLKEGLNVLDFDIDEGDYKLEDIELELEVSQRDYPKYDFEIGGDDYEDLDEGCYDDDNCYDDCEEECDWDCETASCFNKCLDDCEEECEEECDNKVILEMGLGDDEKKKAAITINEDQFNINTNERTYKRDITKMVNRGANFIKIVPKVDFEIELLKIYIRE